MRTRLDDGLPHQPSTCVKEAHADAVAVAPAHLTLKNHIGLALLQIDPLGYFQFAWQADACAVLAHVGDVAIEDAGGIDKDQLAVEINLVARQRATFLHVSTPRLPQT